MNSSDRQACTVNVFALPNQTSLLFGLILLVLLGAILLGSIEPSPILMWPLAVGLFFLPLRAFLAQRSRLIEKYQFVDLPDELVNLQMMVDRLAIEVGMQRSPQLLLARRTLKDVFAFGTPRNWHIGISEIEAKRWQSELVDTELMKRVEAKVIHELYHFKTGDYWQLGYAEALLRTTLIFISWALAFFLAWGIVLLLAVEDINSWRPANVSEKLQEMAPEVQNMILQILPSEEDFLKVSEKAHTINFMLVLSFIASSLFPFIIVATLLWGIYLRLLWRMRELYADAGVVQMQSTVLFFSNALTGIPFDKYPESFQSFLDEARQMRLGLWNRLQELFHVHPDPAYRILVTTDQGLIYGDWLTTAIITGGLTLILDILLASPLTLLYIGHWPMHFSTLAILSVICLNYLVPVVAQGRKIWKEVVKDLFRIVVVVVGIRLVWMLLTILLLGGLLIFAPDFLRDLLDSAVASTARFAGYSSQLGFSDLTSFVIDASVTNLLEIIIIFFVLLLASINVAYPLYRIFTWYGLPDAKNALRKYIYVILGWTLVSWGILILGPITVVKLRNWDEITILTGAIFFLGLSVSMLGIVWFVKQDRKLAQRCLTCHQVVSGTYFPGKVCQDGHPLFEWLLVRNPGK